MNSATTDSANANAVRPEDNSLSTVLPPAAVRDGFLSYHLISPSATGRHGPTYWVVDPTIEVAGGHVGLTLIPPTFQVYQLGLAASPTPSSSLVLSSADLDLQPQVDGEEALGVQPGIHLYLFYCVRQKDLYGVYRWLLAQVVSYDNVAMTVTLMYRGGGVDDLPVAVLRKDTEAMCVGLLCYGMSSFGGHPCNRLRARQAATRIVAMDAACRNGLRDLVALDGILGGKPSTVGRRLNGPSEGSFVFMDEQGRECSVSIAELIAPHETVNEPSPSQQCLEVHPPSGGSQETIPPAPGGPINRSLDEFISRMAGQAQAPAVNTLPAAKDKRDFAPGARSQSQASRLLADRHRGKNPHSLLMEQSRSVHFQPHPARLMALYEGRLGTRFMSVGHLKYLRPDELMVEAEVADGMDYTSKAKLPPLRSETYAKLIRQSLRGLRMFAKAYWRPEVADYTVGLEEFFETTFEANEDSVGDWPLVLRVVDTLIQEFLTWTLCGEAVMHPGAVETFSSRQLTPSNETVRAVWDRITRNTGRGQSKKRNGNAHHQGSDAPTQKRRHQLRLDVLNDLPTVEGKKVCAKFLLGTCEKTKEGVACPNNRYLIHSNVKIDEKVREELKKAFRPRSETRSSN
jgi:hypothetical protein